MIYSDLQFILKLIPRRMEPCYHNGQIVWVKRCEELKCGDIGIFVYDDCGYLKKYDEHTPDKSQAEFFTDSYGVVHNQPVLVSLMGGNYYGKTQGKQE